MLLEERGDLTTAVEAYRRSDARGHAGGAFNLGVLLAQDRPWSRSGSRLSSCRRARRGRGGVRSRPVLEERGELSEAEAAYRRADERGHAAVASTLSCCSTIAGRRRQHERLPPRDNRGDADGAFTSGSSCGSAASERAPRRPSGAPTSAVTEAPRPGSGCCCSPSNRAGAEAAFRRADERGHPPAPTTWVSCLAERGVDAAAEAAFRRADERGHGGAAAVLGVLLVRRGDPDGAEAAFRRADERGHAGGTYNLGRMLALRGDFAAAQRLLDQAARSSDERVTALATETTDESRRRPDA